ncbi:MAG: helix-hairpin-helix domain-containing protein [Synergistaceae bacterium]|nr:helix-hairpin-helix domain-containing protein [Synergistaceae bacterium]
MFGGNRKRGSYFLLVLGLICFAAATILLHSFKGQFGQDTAGKTTVNMMPEMEDTIDVSAPAPASLSQKGASVSSGAVKEEWVVYITGSVKKPGVYTIPAGSRVYQALEAAGGFTAEADQDAVNLAAMLQDGAHIKFPAKGESLPQGHGTSSPVKPASSSGSICADESGKLVNINTAMREELEKLPGIGPKTAQLIIDHREKNGLYERTEDLLLVKGIGPGKYDAVKNLVTVAQ